MIQINHKISLIIILIKKNKRSNSVFSVICAIIAKNFVILAKFCCHPEGIFLYATNSQQEGRFIGNDN